jgi:hypothetical protein
MNNKNYRVAEKLGTIRKFHNFSLYFIWERIPTCMIALFPKWHIKLDLFRI